MKNRTNPKYYVSRQHYWHNGVFAVEIAKGGCDYAGPDMLCETYSSLGEGDTFYDPREAVKAAIAVAEKWRDANSKPVKMVFGQNLDLVCADPISITDAKQRFPKIAKRLYDNAVKCVRCGKIIGEEYWVQDAIDPDEPYCSRYCVEETEREYYLANQLEETE